MTSRRQKARSRSGPDRPEVIIRAEIQLAGLLEIAIDRVIVTDGVMDAVVTKFEEWYLICRR